MRLKSNEYYSIFTLLILIISTLFILISCSEQKSDIAGKWQCVNQGGSFIEVVISNDMTFKCESIKNWKGTWQRLSDGRYEFAGNVGKHYAKLANNELQFIDNPCVNKGGGFAHFVGDIANRNLIFQPLTLRKIGS